MRGVRWALALVLILVFAIAACEKEPIIVGFSGPLTGKYSDIGVEGRNGARLAIEEINAHGGIEGRALKLVPKDDRNLPDVAIAVDKELRDMGAVAILGHMTSSMSLVVMDDPDTKDIIYVSPTTATPALSGLRDNFFRVIPTSQDWAKELSGFARGKLGLKKVVLVGDQDNANYANTFNDAFARFFAEDGGAVVGSWKYSSKKRSSWQGLTDLLVKSGADGMVFSASARDVAHYARLLSKTELNITVLCPSWPASAELLQAGGSGLDNFYFATSHFEASRRLEYMVFKEAYKQRFGYVHSFPAVYGYEAIMLLAKALERTGGSTEGLRDALLSVGPQIGVTGPFSLDEFGDVRRKTFLSTVRGKAFELVGD